MNMRTFKSGGRGRIIIAMVSVLLGASILAVAADKKPAAPAPKPAAKPATTSKPATGTAATHGATTTAGHTTTTTGAHTTTTTGTHTTTTGTHTTTTTGTHTTTGTGVHSTTASHVPAGTTPSHSAISRPVPKGVTEKTTKDGSAIRTRPDGKVSDVHDAKRGMDIHHGLDGSRRVSVERKDGTRLVAERGRPGYVERGYSYHGHDFNRRAYYYHGHEYNRYYNHYYYRGVYVNVYAPGYYYGPAYYGWAYNPWAVPVAYGWGWGVNPWYGYYGFYFRPYPVYPSAAFWLADYLIAANLEAVYAARQAAAAQEAAAAAPADAPAGPPALTPEIKEQIADEVKAQLALENQEAAQNAAQKDIDPGSSGIARLLADGHPHAFVVGSSLDVTDSTGAECALSDGDALAMQTPPPADATTATLVVMSSKGAPECAKSSSVSVSLSDLQEMQNHLRESIDQGLAELKTKQGTGGLPALPPSAQAPPAQPGYAAIAPPPAPTDASDIQAQTAEADKAETEVSAAAQNNAAQLEQPKTPQIPAPAPQSPSAIEIGLTLDDVKSVLGLQSRIAAAWSEAV